ncbi:MAG: LysM peptidoglycan-binding domain-containing protein [Acidobacteriota bacterium]|nr:LysM peptidoglycan-binding domain-containing protein [Acidobacteriota bacterium]
MRSFLSVVLSIGFLATLCTVGCETAQPIKSAFLPAKAFAPEVAAPVEQKTDPPVPKVQPPADPKPDAASALIAQAEKLYASGRENYAAGHLEAAKKDFDQAFNTLLSSNLDLHSDQRLENEFDKVVQAVHELEVAALQKGDGFTEQKSEPAPIDEANDITFPVDPNVTAKAEAEIKTTKSDLPLVMNDQVAMFVNYFSSPRGKATLEHAWARSGRYRDMVLETLKQEGVPQDLIYLAQAESGFQPLAVSRAGARGMWQFMAQSGALYGLQRNWWVDERQDPQKSTIAAARHLKDLYKQFGDWYLAMAAYNTGASNVQHAVERTGYADFWELYRRGVLPKETRNYVPIIVAVTIIAKNPEQYGLEHVAPEPPEKLDHVTITYPVDLRLVAECVDSSVDHLQEINPSLLRLTTPKDQSFTLNLPAGSREKYETAIADIPPDMRTWWRYHRVEYGDTLASVAHKYHTSSSSIAEANSLAGDEVKVGAKLIIPIAPGKQGGETVAYSHKATHYKVRKGDTVDSVADDFEVPADKLRKWNHLRGDSLVVGRTLAIYKPTGSGGPEVASTRRSAPTKSGHKPSKTSDAAQYHKVKEGETLSSIAESYKISVATLKHDNPRLSANLRAGDVLVIHK